MQSTPNVNIIFFGTPVFALPALESLIDAKYTIVAVITKPDEAQGRDLVITPPPIKVLAEKHKIPVFQPVSLSLEQWKNEIPAADCFVVAAYGKLIPKDIIALPRFGTLNIHPSLLPQFRGPSPIQYAILEGVKNTGVTIMLLDELMDHGPILAQKKISLEDAVPHFKELHDTLAIDGATLLIETLRAWCSRTLNPMPQDDEKATYSKILKKDDGRIDWQRPAEEIERKIRAFELWPTSWTLWPGEKQIYRIRIEDAEAVHDESPYGSPGHVWKKDAELIYIKTGKGSIVMKKLTIGGKKMIDAKEFLRGYPQFIGTTLI